MSDFNTLLRLLIKSALDWRVAHRPCSFKIFTCFVMLVKDWRSLFLWETLPLWDDLLIPDHFSVANQLLFHQKMLLQLFIALSFYGLNPTFIRFETFAMRTQLSQFWHWKPCLNCIWIKIQVGEITTWRLTYFQHTLPTFLELCMAALFGYTITLEERMRPSLEAFHSALVHKSHGCSYFHHCAAGCQVQVARFVSCCVYTLHW